MVFGWFRKSRKQAQGKQPVPAKQRSIADVPLLELQQEEGRTRAELAEYSGELNHVVERESRLLDQGKAALDASQKRAIAAEIRDIRKAKARVVARFDFLTKKLETTSQLIAIKEDEAFYNKNSMKRHVGNLSNEEIARDLERTVDRAALNADDERLGIEEIRRKAREYDLTALRPISSSNDDELQGILSELDGRAEASRPNEAGKSVPEEDAQPASPARSNRASDAPSIEQDDEAFEAQLRELESDAPPPRKTELE